LLNMAAQLRMGRIYPTLRLKDPVRPRSSALEPGAALRTLLLQNAPIEKLLTVKCWRSILVRALRVYFCFTAHCNLLSHHKEGHAVRPNIFSRHSPYLGGTLCRYVGCLMGELIERENFWFRILILGIIRLVVRREKGLPPTPA